MKLFDDGEFVGMPMKLILAGCKDKLKGFPSELSLSTFKKYLKIKLKLSSSLERRNILGMILRQETLR